MKFENKKQKIVPIHKFLARLLRYLFFVFLLILFSVGLGVAGYLYFGNLNLVDSFHMACMILTGMGPVAEMASDSAKIFSSLYALYSGIAFLTITAVFFAPLVHRLLHVLHVEEEDR